MMNNSLLRVEGASNRVHVPITSEGKPEISEGFLEKWQSIVDLAARIIDVPAGLIMRIHPKTIEVLVTSRTDGNPYRAGDEEELGLGLYCETAMGRREELLIPFAKEYPYWENNPDTKLNMNSYLGVPILWPDGEVFGTFCVLDEKENHYSQDKRELLHRLAELVQNDLRTVLDASYRVAKAELQNRELRHRIKNQFNQLISYIDLNRHKNTASPTADQLVENMRNRVYSLSRIHELISLSDEGRLVPLVGYVSTLAQRIAESAPFSVEVTVHGETSEVDEQKLIALASLLNELMSNSLNHAFSDVREPRISITLSGEGENSVFEYRDNGTEGSSERGDSTGLGMAIIYAMADQLDGSVAEGRDEGYFFRLSFPLKGRSA